MILVVGHMRSHTSLLMQTLHHLGVSVHGSFEPVDANPKGKGECLETLNGLDTSAISDPNLAIKLLSTTFVYKTSTHPDDKLIFAVRPPGVVAHSQENMGLRMMGIPVRRWNYWRLMRQVLDKAAALPNPQLWVDTERLIIDPLIQIQRLARFLGTQPTAEAVANVDISMTHLEGETLEDDAQAVYREAKARCTT